AFKKIAPSNSGFPVYFLVRLCKTDRDVQPFLRLLSHTQREGSNRRRETLPRILQMRIFSHFIKTGGLDDSLLPPLRLIELPHLAFPLIGPLSTARAADAHPLPELSRAGLCLLAAVPSIA
ncbi:MAG: hypothetical protein ABSE87_16500, partial [Terracidiphilus sp.]